MNTGNKKYYYKDENGKKHYTCSEFMRWMPIERFGVSTFYAVFKNENCIYVDEFEKETLKDLPPLPHVYVRAHELARYLLEQCSPDDIVVLSKDEEGNDYLPVSNELSIDSMYDPKTSSLFTRPGCAEEDDEQDYIGDPKEGHINCVVLWPR